jgi:hypothetical protein
VKNALIAKQDVKMPSVMKGGSMLFNLQVPGFEKLLLLTESDEERT